MYEITLEKSQLMDKKYNLSRWIKYLTSFVATDFITNQSKSDNKRFAFAFPYGLNFFARKKKY